MFKTTIAIFDALLIEGKLEKETTDISRRIIKKLKSLGKNSGGFKNSRFSLGPSVLKNVRNLNRINISLELEPESAGEFSPAVQGVYWFEEKRGDSEIEITISVPSTWRNYATALQDMSDLVSILKDTLRHELEHSSQETDDLLRVRSRTRGFDPYQGPIIAQDPELPEKMKSVSDLRRYYTDKAEIEAFVAGLYKQAKMGKYTFRSVVNARLEAVKRDALRLGATEHQADRLISHIRDMWFEYTKIRFPGAVI